jgi:hypothetical protein
MKQVLILELAELLLRQIADWIQRRHKRQALRNQRSADSATNL